MRRGGESASPPGREAALAGLFFFALTVLMTWPQAAHLDDAMSDLWDSKLNARIVQWDYHQTLHDPFRLFELNFFHPAQDVLAFSENLWGVSLFGYPLLAAGASPLVNYNVVLLLGMFLSALSAWALARYVTGDALASTVAGLVYAFVPWRFSQVSHLQHQWGAFLCLLLLFLLRYLDHGKRRDLVLLTICFAWNALSNVHYAIFSAFLVAVPLVLFVLDHARAGLRRAGAALLGVGLGGCAFVPFALEYRRASELYGFRRHWSEMLFYSRSWRDFLSAGWHNHTWGPLTTRWEGPEGDFFPGLAALALAFLALGAVRRPTDGSVPKENPPGRRRAARIVDGLILLAAALYLAAALGPGLRIGRISVVDAGRVLVCMTALLAVRLAIALPRGRRYADAGDWLRRSPVPSRLTLFFSLAVVGVVVAFGGHTPFYRFLFQSLGGVFGAMRSPARGIVLFHLALAVLAACGLAHFIRGSARSSRVAWTAAALALVGFEYRSFPLKLYPVPSAAPPVYRWLASRYVPGAIVEWPLGFPYDCDYIFRQAQHGKALVNGTSGFFPEPYQRLDASLKQRPIPEEVWRRMGDLGAGLLVYHAHEKEGLGLEAYAITLDRAVASGGLELIKSFPHEDGHDFVFVAAGARAGDAVDDGDRGAARVLFDETTARLRAREQEH